MELVKALVIIYGMVFDHIHKVRDLVMADSRLPIHITRSTRSSEICLRRNKFKLLYITVVGKLCIENIHVALVVVALLKSTRETANGFGKWRLLE